MTTTTTRVLPADVFDALEFSALVYGGIGSLRRTEEREKSFEDLRIGVATPRCVFGHALFLDGAGAMCEEALISVDINVYTNDDAVKAVNERKGGVGRVSFADWCAELGVERGV